MTGRYFEFKAKIVGSSLDDNNALGSIFVVPFKYLSNFQRTLELPLVNCEIDLDLPQSGICIISKTSRTNTSPVLNATTGPSIPILRAAFQTNCTTFW